MRFRQAVPDVNYLESVNALGDVFLKGDFINGEAVPRFEEAFAKYIGTDYAIAVSSGHMGLFLTWLALDLKNGKGVVTTPFTFISTSNSILEAGGTPKFVDIGRDYNIDPAQIVKKVDTGDAICPVHLFGHPCEMESITDLADRKGLRVVEDCCQAHGARFSGNPVGSFGTAGVFSFYPTKNMTVGGDGGMVTTNDECLMAALRSLRNNGRDEGSKDKFVRLGFTARLDTFKAMIGMNQLKLLDDFNERRRLIASEYVKKIGEEPSIGLPSFDGNGNYSVFNQFVVLVSNRKSVASALRSKGVECREMYDPPIYNQPLYRDMGYFSECPVADEIAPKALALPIHTSLSLSDVDDISSILIDVVRNPNGTANIC